MVELHSEVEIQITADKTILVLDLRAYRNENYKPRGDQSVRPVSPQRNHLPLSFIPTLFHLPYF